MTWQLEVLTGTYVCVADGSGEWWLPAEGWAKMAEAAAEAAPEDGELELGAILRTTHATFTRWVRDVPGCFEHTDWRGPYPSELAARLAASTEPYARATQRNLEAAP